MIIPIEDRTALNSLFDLESFKNTKDYRKNKWFIHKDWNTLVVDYFALDDENVETRQLFSLFDDGLKLTSMPFNAADLEGKSFESGEDFLNEMEADGTFRELEFYSWTVYNHTLDIVLIFEADDEAFYLGYHKSREALVQEHIIKNGLVLSYEDYQKHIVYLENLFGEE